MYLFYIYISYVTYDWAVYGYFDDIKCVMSTASKGSQDAVKKHV